MKALRFLTLLAFLLAGCAATPKATATVTPAAIDPTATVEILPTTTEPAPLPTEAAAPAVIQPTNTPSIEDQERAAILPLVEPCTFVGDHPISYSPNKTWVVVACQGHKPEDGIIQKFARMDNQRHISLSFKGSFIDPYRSTDPDQSGLLKLAFVPVRWTANEDFVYLAAPTPDNGNPYKGYYGLFRLNLVTDELAPTLTPVTAPATTTYAFQFSPRGGKLAYITQGVLPLTILIEDSATGGETEIKLGTQFTQASNLLWAEDEQHLVYSVYEPNKGGAVVLYNLGNAKIKYVVEQSDDAYLPLSWVNNVVVYAEKYPGSWVYINVSTQEITEAPAP
jgi:hypothetical protein